jgi:hypothetical protein
LSWQVRSLRTPGSTNRVAGWRCKPGCHESDLLSELLKVWVTWNCLFFWTIHVV